MKQTPSSQNHFIIRVWPTRAYSHRSSSPHSSSAKVSQTDYQGCCQIFSQIAAEIELSANKALFDRIWVEQQRVCV